MNSRAVVVHLYEGETRTGLWCEACLLPSVVEVDVAALTPSGVNPRFGVWRHCDGCGRQ